METKKASGVGVVRRRAARSRLRHVLRAGAADRVDRRRARGRARDARRRRARSRSPKPRSSACARAPLKTIDDALADPHAVRRPPLRVDRARRLASVLPRSATGSARVTPADVQRVALALSQASNLTVGEFIPDAKPDRAPLPPPVDVAAMVKDYKGDAAAGGRRAVRRHARQPRRAHAALHARQRHEGRAAAEEDARRGRARSRCSSTRATRSRCSARRRRARSRRHARRAARRSDRARRSRTRSTSCAPRSAFSGAAKRARRPPRRPTATQLPDTLRLVAEMLREPAFPASRVREAAARGDDRARSSRTDPQSDRAARASRRYGNPYPAGDPRYVPTDRGGIALVRKTTVDDVKRFHAHVLRRQRRDRRSSATSTPMPMRALLERAFGTWKKAAPYTRVPDPLVKKAPTVADRRDARQGQRLAVRRPRAADQRREPRLPAPCRRELHPRRRRDVAPVEAHPRARRPVLRRLLRTSAGTRSSPTRRSTCSAIFAPENRARLATALHEEFDARRAGRLHRCRGARPRKASC